MKSPKILIIGTGNLRNYGCEAIVQGTYNIIKKTIPNALIYIASEDFKYDSSVLPKDINLVKYKNRFTIKRIFRGILRRYFHIGNGSEVRMKSKLGNKFDIVLSCGGDNFCERPDFGIYNILVDLMKIGENAVNSGKKYFLWGASVGPFHHEDVRKRVISNLEKCNHIFVRETLTEDYLSQFFQLKSKIKLVADPAFQMAPDNYNLTKDPHKIYVGINMSLLAIAHSCGENDNYNESIAIMASLLDALLKGNSNIEIYFIPHVVISGTQDDMNCLRQLYEYLNLNHHSRIHLIERGLGSRKTKALISKMDLLIAARMHCCVAGISTGTPTLFLTYSNKGKGMSYYAYGHHDFEINCKDLFKDNNLLLSKIELMINNKEKIKNALEKKKSTFLADSLFAGKILKSHIDI